MKRAYSATALALLISLFIYLFYRTRKTVVNELTSSFLSNDTFTGLRHNFSEALPLHDLIRFSLPGGLWVFCMTILSHGLYLEFRRKQIPLVAMPLLFAFGLEFCQLLHITQGTFDLWDLVSYMIFWLLAWSGFRSNTTQQNLLSPFSLKSFMCMICFLSVYLAHVNP